MYLSCAVAYYIHMGRHSKRTILIDNLLDLITNRELTSSSLLSPKTQKFLNQPAYQYLSGQGSNKSAQEMRACLRYMKYNQLILINNSGELSITAKAKKRLDRAEIEHIFVTKPKIWDKKWRLVLYEIPENKKSQRDAFASKMKQLGFRSLKNSVLVYPFDCQTEIDKIVQYYGITNYIIYAEVAFISSQSALLKKFSTLLRNK